MRKTAPAIVAAILLAAVLAGCSAEESHYPENSHGLTYGNGMDIDAVTSEHPLPSGSTPEEAKAWIDEYYPDLMAVKLSDGTVGYSYVDDMRTTYHFVDLGDGHYAEVRGTFPEAAYAEDPEYFDYAFRTIATNEWMDAWTDRG